MNIIIRGKDIWALLILLLIMPSEIAAQREFDFYFDISDFEITLSNGKVSVQPKIPDASFSDDTSLPAFPFFTKRILLPQNTISLQETVSFDQNLLYSNALVDANPPLMTTNGEILGEVGDEVESLLNPVFDGGVIRFGDYRYICFHVTPFLYDADWMRLYFVPHVKITVPSYPTTTGNSPISDWPLAFRDVAAGLANYQDLGDFYTEPLNGVGSSVHTLDYLIITNSTLAGSFLGLAEWKQRKGLITEIATTDSIYANVAGT